LAYGRGACPEQELGAMTAEFFPATYPEGSLLQLPAGGPILIVVDEHPEAREVTVIWRVKDTALQIRLPTKCFIPYKPPLH
jgi:hypothetical protein